MTQHTGVPLLHDDRLARLDARLEELHLEGHWRLPLASRREPSPFAKPFAWRWNDVRSTLIEAGEIHELEADAGRRTVRLCTPGLAGNKTTPTLQTSIQLVKPGEIAPAHRHTMGALRYVIEGSGGYTTVNGAKLVMEPGDLVLTPGWSWHDHGHDGDVPMIWIDGHDFPFTHFINGFFSQGYTQPQQAVTSIGAPDEHYVYKGSRSREQLAALGENGADPAWGPTVTFTNPRTGGSTLPTMLCRLSRLQPGRETARSRRTASVVYHVTSGSGVTHAGTEELHWNTGDFFVVPAWTWQQHRAEGAAGATLFSISDEPILDKFGVLRSETEPGA
jgi:gentisate 1,2-dioxygenase